MARLYTVENKGSAVALSATIHLVEVLAPAAKAIRLKRVRIGDIDSTLPSSQMIPIEIGTGITALGSTGTSLTPAKTNPADAAASFTAKLTTANGTGTAAAVIEDGFHVYNGYDVGSLDPVTPALLELAGATGFYILLPFLSTAPTLALSFTLWVEEVG